MSILVASRVGAKLALGRLPVSSSLPDFRPNDAEHWQLKQRGGGDLFEWHQICYRHIGDSAHVH